MRTALLLVALLFSATPALAARTILIFGDSLSAGYGIRPEQAWPSLLEKRLSERRLDYSVVNVSISGETTAGGRARLPEALQRHKPAVVVIALGANDGLRGLPLGQMRDNLAAMLDAAQSTGRARCSSACACRPTTAPTPRNSQRVSRTPPGARKAPRWISCWRRLPPTRPISLPTASIRHPRRSR
jgi:acyl-CoA thioesterase-1